MNEQTTNNSTQIDSQASLQQLYQLRKDAISSLLLNLESIEGSDPERKFEIYMSAVRLAHDPSIISPALKAAMAIDDASIQSEALIDVIQEINYSIGLLEATPGDTVNNNANQS